MNSSTAAAVVVSVALLAGCASPSPDGASPQPSRVDHLTVFAAASLTSTFTELGAAFESAHPGTTVTFNFAGSSSLVTQLAEGAPADVFASADTANMSKAADAGLLSGDPVDFASNTLTIVTPPGNPRGITSFADLAAPGIQVVVCAPQVPCGAAAAGVEQATGVTLTPVSEESAVTDVLGKITSGQADAGLVYATDAAGAGDKVTAIAFPESADAVNTYPIAALSESANPAAAQRFIELVTGPQGQQVLTSAGFAGP
ncbi:molybdate ABC transporter substrate-binding protein [Mycobacterium sp. Y57]|uniref:molybdate ABC transporter substrate-binding protein n=1 Tax=Mycolicibacterium xanthum TaxID=2796469 RepID=UPI001C8612C7|nr:molybdate ABC transporter substrate-binding protein [Mycolicibacterium xanthum]MBX7435328.1 molybdate ABC transporter substrate-binding protein [Mycolicibacterium xanthum]